MKRILLLVLLTSALLPSMAQTDTLSDNRRPYLGLTFGLKGVTVKDALVMPVRYSGTNPYFSLSYLKEKPKSIQEIYIDLNVGSVKTKDADIENFGTRYIEPRAQFYMSEIGYSWMRALPRLSNEKYRVHMGAESSFLFNVRFSPRWDNSGFNYEGVITPLAWQGRIARDFKTKRKKLTLSYQLNIPVLAFVMRPEFSGVPDFLNHEKPFTSDLFERGSWESFWGLPRIKSTLDLTIPIAGKNFMKFTYGWNYYSYQDPVKTQFAGHSFLFTLYTRL